MTSVDESRGLKRVRQACLNCRRKKVRCSGERPICAFCDRLSQKCLYEAQTEDDDVRKRYASNAPVDDLLFRVRALESKLADLGNLDSNLPAMLNAVTEVNSLKDGWARDSDAQGQKDERLGRDASPSQISDPDDSFSILPPQNVIEAALDTFFLYCHNQPYSFFREDKLRTNVKEHNIASCLLYAFLASAVRYSQDPYFDSRRSLAVDGYARMSWRIIMSSDAFINEEIDIQVLQAICLLSIIDSTAGRRRAAWVKIGLAVRISQDLQLMMEPDSSLSHMDQEEHRRLFWSIYLLDRLVSCSRQRPPTILDRHCQVQLPAEEVDFRNGIFQRTGTLQEVFQGTAESSARLGYFSRSIMVASALGSCSRYVLDSQNKDGKNPSPPWDSHSEYASIQSMLLRLEALCDMDMEIKQVIEREMTVEGEIDQQRAGHFILSRALYHLCHCLVNHPFLLRQRSEEAKSKVPNTWLQNSLKLGHMHACAQSKLFRDAQRTGCLAVTSIYGYCILISGTVHALYTHSSDENLRQQSLNHLSADLAYLTDVSRFWKNSSLIASGLKAFWINSGRYRALINTVSSKTILDPADERILWSIMDYLVMSDPKSTLSNIGTGGSPEGWIESPGVEPNDCVDALDQQRSPQLQERSGHRTLVNPSSAVSERRDQIEPSFPPQELFNVEGLGSLVGEGDLFSSLDFLSFTRDMNPQHFR